MDMSRYAMGAVLSQLCKDDKWHLIGFMSKILSNAERNYETLNRELLSVIQGLEKWRHILEGTRHNLLSPTGLKLGCMYEKRLDYQINCGLFSPPISTPFLLPIYHL